MKILFLIYHGFSEHSGISKKIHYQVKGLRENGHEVRLCYYGFAENGHRCRYIDDRKIKDYGIGKLAAIRQRLDYGRIFDYCVNEHIEFVYARCFQNANPWLIQFFKKLKKSGIHAVTEIPTYPYDEEFKNFGWKMRMGLKIDQLFRRKLYQQMDAMVTFSDAKVIFGQKTINISNGVDFDSIPLHSCQQPIASGPLHLIGVAEVHAWHGFDRVMSGIGEYYNRKITNGSQQREVFFHVVGGVHPNRMSTDFAPVIEKYGLHNYIIFHGQLFGDELTKVFNQCQFAIGSLGRHRSGITVIKTLKKYLKCGIPFIYSEQDSDFDQQPYVIKAPADDSPIDVQQIINFLEHFSMSPEAIRSTVKHLTWKLQMQQVVDSVF